MTFSAAASPLWAWLQLGQGIADQTSGGLVYLLEMSPPAITLHTSDPCHQNWILSTTTIDTIWEENIREGEYYSNGFHGESDEDFNNFLLHHQRIIVRHQCIPWKPFCKMFGEKSWIYRRTTGGGKRELKEKAKRERLEADEAERIAREAALKYKRERLEA